MNAVLIGSRAAPSRAHAGLLERLSGWHQRVQGRRHLAALDARLLADIGLTRDQVREEIAKPFWLP